MWLNLTLVLAYIWSVKILNSPLRERVDQIKNKIASKIWRPPNQTSCMKSLIRKLPKSQHYHHYHSPSTWNNETSLFKTKRAQKNMRAWVYQLPKTWICPWIELELTIMLLLQFSQKRLGDKVSKRPDLRKYNVYVIHIHSW